MFKELIDWYLGSLESGGYALIVLLMAIESSVVPLPSELVIPPAAHLAHTKGNLSMAGMVAAGTICSWLDWRQGGSERGIDERRASPDLDLALRRVGRAGRCLLLLRAPPHESGTGQRSGVNPDERFDRAVACGHGLKQLGQPAQRPFAGN